MSAFDLVAGRSMQWSVEQGVWPEKKPIELIS